MTEGDWAAQAVDFGGYQRHMFDPSSPHGCALPRTPPPAARYGDVCHCPSCQSEGWYAQSPVCRFWRADCEVCDGARYWIQRAHPGDHTRLPCDFCVDAWAADVRFFLDALRSPRRVAQQLRDEAVRLHAITAGGAA